MSPTLTFDVLIASHAGSPASVLDLTPSVELEREARYELGIHGVAAAVVRMRDDGLLGWDTPIRIPSGDYKLYVRCYYRDADLVLAESRERLAAFFVEQLVLNRRVLHWQMFLTINAEFGLAHQVAGGAVILNSQIADEEGLRWRGVMQTFARMCEEAEVACTWIQQPCEVSEVMFISRTI